MSDAYKLVLKYSMLTGVAAIIAFEFGRRYNEEPLSVVAMVFIFQVCAGCLIHYDLVEGKEDEQARSVKD